MTARQCPSGLVPFDEIADELGVSETTARRDYDSAVAKFCAALPDLDPDYFPRVIGRLLKIPRRFSTEPDYREFNAARVALGIHDRPPEPVASRRVQQVVPRRFARKTNDR